MRDLIFAGADTSAVALKYAILHIALQPEIQRKIQQEIDSVIGRSRVPSLVDKSRLKPIISFVLLKLLLRIITSC